MVLGSHGDAGTEHMRWLLLFLLLPFAAAEEYHMKLLAVSEAGGAEQGMTADLYLQTKPGTGRVFIDTFPLTKVDTQISTRFAKSIACNELDVNCEDTDFFYTIRSNSVIIGGPSAGAALTTLTMAALKGYKIDESVAVTGTINSGGLVGPVGGLKAKIEAASEDGIEMVLIPMGERVVNESNVTVDLVEFGKEIGVEVIEVATISEVFLEFTGIDIQKYYDPIEVSGEYQEIMSLIAQDLCTRTDDLMKGIDDDSSLLYNQSINLSLKGKLAISDNRHYSGASYCFASNIKLSELSLIQENVTDHDLQQRILTQKLRVLELEEQTDSMELQTLGHLQTYEIVKERLLESLDYFNKSRTSITDNETELARYYFAYGVERYNSAVAWSAFYNAQGASLELDDDTVRESCVQKLAEAEERYQYVQLYFPMLLTETRKQIDRAYDELNAGNHILCLFKASKSKAEADVVLSAIGISDDLDSHLQIKRGVVEQVIARQQHEGHFPILGYSYYEYAMSLAESDPYSALLYLEYALELSNLDMYFTRPGRSFDINLDWRDIIIYGLGIATGMLIIIFRRKTLANTQP